MEKVKTREEAYAILDSERAYQDAKGEDAEYSHIRNDISPGEHILAMEKCLTDARLAWYNTAMPHGPAAEHVRKVGALALRFIEYFGASRREGF